MHTMNVYKCLLQNVELQTLNLKKSDGYCDVEQELEHLNI